jgi:hypothetical protein
MTRFRCWLWGALALAASLLMPAHALVFCATLPHYSVVSLLSL